MCLCYLQRNVLQKWKNLVNIRQYIFHGFVLLFVSRVFAVFNQEIFYFQQCWHSENENKNAKQSCRASCGWLMFTEWMESTAGNFNNPSTSAPLRPDVRDWRIIFTHPICNPFHKEHQHTSSSAYQIWAQRSEWTMSKIPVNTIALVFEYRLENSIKFFCMLEYWWF